MSNDMPIWLKYVLIVPSAIDQFDIGEREMFKRILENRRAGYVYGDDMNIMSNRNEEEE